MTNQQILERAIHKAIDGGWKGVRSSYGTGTSFYYPREELLEWQWNETGRIFHDGEYEDYESVNVEAIIFDHDFAKALWGEYEMRVRKAVTTQSEETMYPVLRPRVVNMGWRHHLQQMVLAEDPIKYLGENI